MLLPTEGTASSKRTWGRKELDITEGTRPTPLLQQINEINGVRDEVAKGDRVQQTQCVIWIFTYAMGSH